jgi:hypothetical protein
VLYILCMWISFLVFSASSVTSWATVEHVIVTDSRRISEAAERLATLVSDLDLVSTLPATCKELVALGERIERTGRTLKSLAAAKVASSVVWQGEGDRSAEDWLARTTGTTRAEAARELETGKHLCELPEVAQAASTGELSTKQVEAIAGAAAANPAAAGRLLDAAKQKGLRELQDECRTTRTNADPDPEATRARIHAKRSYRTWTEPDGTGHVHLSGPADAIARIDNAVRHRCDKLFREARRDGRREAGDAYAFDAALQLLTASGDATPVPTGADAKIIVRVDLPALLRGRPGGGEVCEVAGLGPLPVSVVKDWMDDAFLAAVLTKGTEIATVVHLGRRFLSKQRTVLQWEDPVCARTGCSNRLGLQYDHFEDWALTHTTRTSAAKRFCASCHALKTAGWTVSEPDAEGQCTFTAPAGARPTTTRAGPDALSTATPGELLAELQRSTRRAISARRAAVANAPP